VTYTHARELEDARDFTLTDEYLPQALAGRADVTVRVYTSLNHLFAPGEGPPSPAEYERAQHVDPAVIEDIAGWLR